MTLDIEDICIDKEFEELLPKLTMDEFENLEKNILKNGLLDPLKIWNDPETNKWVLIDGHNRYKIIKKNNISFDTWNGFKIMYEEELPTRDDVKEWMLEQQLGRRNLSEMDRYEIVQKFKDIIANKAKKNQSLGGKGVSNLSKVNTRKVLADKVGVSEGTYGKLDKIAQFGNDEVKQQLKNKKVSVDKAYKMVKEPKKETPLTPIQRIGEIDNRLNEIDREISSLHTEKLALVRKRTMLFEALDMKCELKYDLEDAVICRKCIFYIEVDGHREIFVECMVLDEEPCVMYVNKIPDVYKDDFTMLYRKAHLENLERTREYNEKFTRTYEQAYKNDLKNAVGRNIDKDFYKKCFRVLVKNFHPDNGEGSIEDMQLLTQLKQMWEI